MSKKQSVNLYLVKVNHCAQDGLALQKTILVYSTSVESLKEDLLKSAFKTQALEIIPSTESEKLACKFPIMFWRDDVINVNSIDDFFEEVTILKVAEEELSILLKYFPEIKNGGFGVSPFLEINPADLDDY